MNIQAPIRQNNATSGGSLVILLVVVLTTSVALAGLMSLVSQQSRLTRRRQDLVSALQYAQGGAVIAIADLNTALNNRSNIWSYNLAHGTYPYTTATNTTNSSQKVIYQRTIGAPFTGQLVAAQIIVTNPTTPNSATIVATATVGYITQTATVHCKLAWGYPAAIISVNPGTSETSVSKSVGQDGNVVINGDKSGPIVVDGNVAKAVLANGRVNWDTNYLRPPPSVYSMSNYSTASEIPDYTSLGSSNALFDFNRFIAVADKTPGGPSPSGNNHFTNFNNFLKAITNTSPANPMEGVVVVDVTSKDASTGIDSKAVPNGVNVHGTLMFNFIGSGWDPVSEKFIVTADMNVNAANLAGLVATNPATYPTGYPPVYSNQSKNPTNIDITSKGFANFAPGDDLPALIYTIGCLDMHGNANISGVMYTPSYMEIENKGNGQTQYLKGALIMGHGIYYENTSAATSIISFDANTLDSITTMGTAGKQVSVTYWE